MTSFEKLLETCSHIDPVGQYTILILENPKSQLCSLEREVLDQILSDIHITTANGFGVPLERKSAKGIKDHVFSVDLLAIVYRATKLYGFASAKIIGDTFFLHGIALCAKSQGCGVGSIVLESMLKRKGCSYIAFTTQNPAMYLLARKFTINIYPSPIHTSVPVKYKDLAHQYVKDRRGTFIPEEMVVRNLYAECLYPCIKHVADESVDCMFRDRLQISESGITCDGFICIGTVALHPNKALA